MKVLVLNAGSSSLKFRLLDMDREGDLPSRGVLADGLVEKWGTPEAALRVTVTGKAPEHRSVSAQSPVHAAEHAIEACRSMGVDALGYRVVHGGPRFHEPTRVTPEVIEGIRQVSQLAPLHNGLALAGIEAGRRLMPGVPSVAVFDTAFHRTMPPVAAQYAIPTELAETHSLRRYGFHGISHRYVSVKLLECMGRRAEGSRLITCHLGNGSSLCALRDGRCVDTSMGLTPMEGLVMGTRSGDIDPGLVIHLITTLRMKADEVNDLLNRRSGMKGVSGRSGDLRDLEQAMASGDQPSRLALEMFAYRARKYVGAYAAVLGGMDGLAFAGGIGEHSSRMRGEICAGLGFLGIELDPALNAAAHVGMPARVSPPGAAVEVWVIPTDEEREIAREIVQLLSAG